MSTEKRTLLGLSEIRSQIDEMSGGGKKLARQRRANGIYTSFTLPGLDDMIAVRDSRARVTEFLGGPDVRLDGKTFIDIGANVGGMLFEFARRGAICSGVEYRSDRVQLMRSIAAYYLEHGHVTSTESNCVVPAHSAECEYDDVSKSWTCSWRDDGRGGRKWLCPSRIQLEESGWEWRCVSGCLADPLSEAEFYACDLNGGSGGTEIFDTVWARRQYDAVLCTAVDNYIEDRPRFYRLLRSLVAPGGVLYYECNVNRGSYPVESVVANMTEAGFSSVEHLGTGQDQFLRRKIYRVRP